MKRLLTVATVILMAGCNMFDKTTAYEPTCTPIDFGVPDSVAIVEAQFCR